MNVNGIFGSTRTRAGELFSAGIAVATMALAGFGEVRAEEEITPEDVYYFACATCHQGGLNGAPKYGDRKAWSPRIEQGREKLYENTINGKAAMPPKGGKPGLTDEQVKMAVDYMVNAAGGWPGEN